MSAAGRAAVDALLEILAQERKAIRTLDGTGVEHAAKVKENLVSLIGAMEPGEFVDEAENLVVLRAELRRNGVLLAHARASLKEASAITGRNRRVRARV